MKYHLFQVAFLLFCARQLFAHSFSFCAILGLEVSDISFYPENCAPKQREAKSKQKHASKQQAASKASKSKIWVDMLSKIWFLSLPPPRFWFYSWAPPGLDCFIPEHPQDWGFIPGSPPGLSFIHGVPQEWGSITTCQFWQVVDISSWECPQLVSFDKLWILPPEVAP